MTYDDIDKKEQEPLVIKDQTASKADTKPRHIPLIYEGKEQKRPTNAPTQTSDQTNTFQQPFETRQRVDVAHQSRIIQKGIKEHKIWQKQQERLLFILSLDLRKKPKKVREQKGR